MPCITMYSSASLFVFKTGPKRSDLSGSKPSKHEMLHLLRGNNPPGKNFIVAVATAAVVAGGLA